MESIQAHDLGILYWFGSLHRPWLDPVVVYLTHLGDNVGFLEDVFPAADPGSPRDIHLIGKAGLATGGLLDNDLQPGLAQHLTLPRCKSNTSFLSKAFARSSQGPSQSTLRQASYRGETSFGKTLFQSLLYRTTPVRPGRG